MASESAEIARAVIAERGRITAWLLKQQIREPEGETEDHVNGVIFFLAEDIRKGAHLRD